MTQGPLLTDPEPWAPTRFTRPLGDTIHSDGPKLCALLERYYRTPDGAKVKLDLWQRALFTSLLEVFPPGHALAGELRYRQAVVSLGRQNGKSLIAAGLALYGLLQHVRGASVVGLATSVEQARVIYDRVDYAVRNSPALNKRLKPTGTRGIRRRDGQGTYRVFPALAEGLQSVPVTLGIADELHLMKPAVWDSIVNGQRAQRSALLIGITTAGDDASTLLLRLYEQGKAAINDPESRFGFFLWEAPEHPSLDNDDHIKAANPAIACGRINIDTVRRDAAGVPAVDRERYLFNRFIAQVNAWLPMDRWRNNAGHRIPDDVDARRLTFGIARTDAWEHATITANLNTDGHIITECVASLARPNRAQLVALATHLLDTNPGSAIALEAGALSSVGKELRDNGHEAWLLTNAEMAQASAAAYAAITQGALLHAGDELLTRQLPTIKRTNTHNGTWRVIKGTGDADAALATIIGAYVADVRPAPTMLLL